MVTTSSDLPLLLGMWNSKQMHMETVATFLTIFGAPMNI